MEAQDTVKQAYQEIVIRLTDKLNATGYQVVEEKSHDLVFGSCYTIWSNNEDALRLTWDGKERWFSLEEATLPISAMGPWNEIIITSFNPDIDGLAYINGIIEMIIKSLN